MGWSYAMQTSGPETLLRLFGETASALSCLGNGLLTIGWAADAHMGRDNEQARVAKTMPIQRLAQRRYSRPFRQRSNLR
jgi:hypothetical protein